MRHFFLKISNLKEITDDVRKSKEKIVKKLS